MPDSPHFQHPFRHFHGQPAEPATTVVLPFAEVGGDEGLLNAVAFFWNLDIFEAVYTSQDGGSPVEMSVVNESSPVPPSRATAEQRLGANAIPFRPVLKDAWDGSDSESSRSFYVQLNEIGYDSTLGRYVLIAQISGYDDLGFQESVIATEDPFMYDASAEITGSHPFDTALAKMWYNTTLTSAITIEINCTYWTY